MWVASATIERCRGRGKDTLRKRGGYDARAAGWSSGGTPENPALAVAPRWGTIPYFPPNKRSTSATCVLLELLAHHITVSPALFLALGLAP